MDMGSSTVMNMATATTAAATATTTAAMSMGGGSCKISMLWNWTVIDACFIARSWHITSKGMFAGSCIGVILLVMSLELLRRGAVEYDNYLRERHLSAVAAANGGSVGSSASGSSSPTTGGINKGNSAAAIGVTASCAPANAPIPPFRPNVLQQAVRALLHTLQFAVAYFVMLLAMYYNGYIIICIFIGAYIGSFVFGWETFKPLRMKEEVTVCCG